MDLMVASRFIIVVIQAVETLKNFIRLGHLRLITIGKPSFEGVGKSIWSGKVEGRSPQKVVELEEIQISPQCLAVSDAMEGPIFFVDRRNRTYWLTCLAIDDGSTNGTDWIGVL